MLHGLVFSQVGANNAFVAIRVETDNHIFLFHRDVPFLASIHLPIFVLIMLNKSSRASGAVDLLYSLPVLLVANFSIFFRV